METLSKTSSNKIDTWKETSRHTNEWTNPSSPHMVPHCSPLHNAQSTLAILARSLFLSLALTKSMAATIEPMLATRSLPKQDPRRWPTELVPSTATCKKNAELFPRTPPSQCLHHSGTTSMSSVETNTDDSSPRMSSHHGRTCSLSLSLSLSLLHEPEETAECPLRAACKGMMPFARKEKRALLLSVMHRHFFPLHC